MSSYGDGPAVIKRPILSPRMFLCPSKYDQRTYHRLLISCWRQLARDGLKRIRAALVRLDESRQKNKEIDADTNDRKEIEQHKKHTGGTRHHVWFPCR